MATVGKPAIATPNVGTEKALRNWQLAIGNIRERFEALEAAFNALETETTARASVAATTTTSIQRDLRTLLARVNAAIAGAEQLLALFSLTTTFADGDIWVYRDSVAQFVPEPGGAGEGGVLPVVTGEILNDQPVFVFLEDGSLVYLPVEA